MAAQPPRLAWLLNLDADRELQAPASYRPMALPGTPRAWTAHMADLVAPDDVLLDEPSFDLSALRDNCLALAFCPTPRALARIVALGLRAQRAPALTILRRVNDRAFCASLGQTLPSACFARDMQALEQHLTRPSPSGSYVIKRAFSFAGREQRRVRDGIVDDSTRGFCQRSFSRGEGVQIEPWLQRLSDASAHAYLGRDGSLALGEPRELQCDAMGRFLGVSCARAELNDEEAALLRRELAHCASALHAAGYFGPFGIDAFRYRLSDQRVAFNPRCEINARFTMGYPRALLQTAIMDSAGCAL